jgi:hypothetical protein
VELVFINKVNTSQCQITLMHTLLAPFPALVQARRFVTSLYSS